MDTEEKLVLAALRQFEKHGFIAATTKAIAAEAGGCRSHAVSLFWG